MEEIKKEKIIIIKKVVKKSGNYSMVSLSPDFKPGDYVMIKKIEVKDDFGIEKED
jgi:hypothetical protein